MSHNHDGENAMSAIKYQRVTYDNKEVPASFHDALLKLKDATSKQWVSFDADGSYQTDGKGRPIYCAIGYLLPVEYRRQLMDSDKFVKDLPKVLGITKHELETYLGMDLVDAAKIQTEFDKLSRNYLTVVHKPYIRQDAIAQARTEARHAWHAFLDSFFEHDNYSFL